MNTTNYIRIFRGDDSDALGYQTIVGTIKTDLDLTGCKAVFRFLGFYAEFDPIPEDGKLTIVIPAQASRGFPPGVGYASLKVLDSLGKIRTFTNRIPVIVDTMTPSCEGGEFEVSFSPFPELEPLKIFVGPNPDDFDQYTGFLSKIIDRASLVKYGLVVLADAMSEDGGASGKAASPLAVKAAYDAIIKELTDNYYTANETDEAIDRVAAYYITYDAAGNPFPTYAALANAQTVYSGGKVRTPTRNDYCVVLADETHDNAEYRYIYAVADGETTGSWQPQFPVEGVMTVDQTVTKNSQNPVSGGGIWSMIWGALSALPTGFASLYGWVVAQLGLKRDYTDMTCDKQGFPAEGSGFFIVTKPDGTKVQLNPFSRDGIKGWSSSGDYSVYPIVFLQGSGAYINYRATIDNTSGGFRDLNQNTPVNTIEYDDETWVFAAYTGEKDEIAVKSQTVPTSRTVNGAPLSSDVTLTGADIPVDATQGAQKISAALAGKASKSDVDSLLFAQYYPDGNVKSVAEFTAGIKYDAPDEVNRTITVKPFCNTGDSANDNSGLEGRVVIPPFVDANGNGYISDDGTRYKVVGVSGGSPNNNNLNLTAIVVPTTLKTIGGSAFSICGSLTSVFLPAAETVENNAFDSCISLYSVDFGDTPRPSVPTLGTGAFYDVPTSCKIIVPYTQYDAWIAADNWKDLPQEFVRHTEKADKPATFTTGNLAKFDANGNPMDSGKKPSDFQSALSDTQLANIAAVPDKLDKSGGTVTGGLTFYNPQNGAYIYFPSSGKAKLNFGSGLFNVNDETGRVMINLKDAAVVDDIPYDLGTPTVIVAPGVELVEGEPIYYGVATLANRTANIVQVTAATALDELRITFPAATSGKVRDFGLRVEIGTGSDALAAPALVPIAPTGETIKLENADGAIPALADGTATAKGVTLLYFSENAPGVFVVKGEQVEEVA